MIRDEVRGAIHFSKLQALIKGNDLVLTHLPGTDDWSSGMLLFVDNGQHVYTHDTRLVHQWYWHSAGIHLEWHGFQSKDYILFTPDIISSTLNGTFVITNTLQQVKLIMNRLGRIRETTKPLF